MYCKFVLQMTIIDMKQGINSSKVYCKYECKTKMSKKKVVLIVAKCIVNFTEAEMKLHRDFSINSSKVYCKFKSHRLPTIFFKAY